jgi:hypothetical protein
VIIIGGVGVPLSTLPAWAQKVAGFFPGRYAVEAMQPCFNRADGLNGTAFALIALTVIGVAGCVAGAKLFRWDQNQQIARSARLWVVLAVASWIAVGSCAAATGHLKPVRAGQLYSGNPSHGPWDSITDQQINSFTFKGLTSDSDTVAPVAASATGVTDPDEEKRMERIVKMLATWPPGQEGDDGQRVRNLLSAAAVADLSARDPSEGQIARAVFDRLQADFDKDELIHILAWIITKPDQGSVIADAPEIDIHGPMNEESVRDRDVIYAQKLLGRLLEKIPNVSSD